MLRGELDVYGSVCIGDLRVVTTPSIAGRILDVSTRIDLIREGSGSSCGDAVRTIRADGVAGIEGRACLRLLVDDVDDTTEGGVSYAHRSSPLEHLDMVHCSHPRQRCRLPEGVTLVTHPVTEDNGLIEATEEEHMEASVVLEGSYAWYRLHGLRWVCIAEEAHLLQRKDVSRQRDLTAWSRDLDDCTGCHHSGTTYDNFADDLSRVGRSRSLGCQRRR